MIEVIDNVLEDHTAILIDDYVKNLSWRFDYKSEKGQPNKHWHVFCGHNKKECDERGFDWAHLLFESAKNKIGKELFYGRVYCNAHTHGVEPHLHKDEGEFTIIFYPRLDWKQEWNGGTLIDGQLVEYVGNRLVVFTAHLPHKAMPVSRECYELRTCVVFKCHGP